MSDLPWSVFAPHLALSLASLFAASALLHAAAPRLLRPLYQHSQFARTAGLVQGLAALFLVMPQLRVWGVILGAMILFALVVSLLNHRRYWYALPAILCMVALVPALA